MSIENNKSINNCSITKIKSKYILSKIFGNLQEKRSLEILRYNKRLSNKLNKNIKEYLKLIIEIIPEENKYGTFINIYHKEDEIYFHIYFNDGKEEINRTYISEDDKVEKIKIIIDYKIKSLWGLFRLCKCIKKINFIKKRDNIKNMSHLFFLCSSLKEINLSNFNTTNVEYMCYMFYGCNSLKELNLSYFNTNNLINIRSIFQNCSSLKKLNISNFLINRNVNAKNIFENCFSLGELDLSHFLNENVEFLKELFNLRHTLKKIICSEEIRLQILFEFPSLSDRIL